jgi:hypothetical protein
MNFFGSPLQNWLHLTQYVYIFKRPKLKQKLKLDQMKLYSKLFNIHKRAGELTYQDYYGFKL